jgi:hypothetical protein
VREVLRHFQDKQNRGGFVTTRPTLPKTKKQTKKNPLQEVLQGEMKIQDINSTLCEKIKIPEKVHTWSVR